MKQEPLLLRIDQAIRDLWQHNICEDYQHVFLLREDSLKNAFYHHLRTKLGDFWLLKHRIRIFTEFHTLEGRADLAVVQMKEKMNPTVSLQNNIESYLAIIEMKFLSVTDDTLFQRDIEKIRNYIINMESQHPKCHFYAAFLQEAIYPEDWTSWVDPHDNHWAIGRFTELHGFMRKQDSDVVCFHVCAHDKNQKEVCYESS